jgi:putative membrane protein
MEERANSQKLAARRTEWADERTRMAGERTFAAWIRTGLALVAGGLASARLLTSVEPQWLVRVMGSIFDHGRRYLCARLSDLPGGCPRPARRGG